MKLRINTLALTLALAMVLLFSAFALAQEVTPSVTVQDQEVTGGTVTVAEVVAAQDGWMVIHAQKDGGIGPVIGHAPVTAGSNTDVVVEIDTTAATETLYAMLHVDEGEAGVYEFPGPDGPVVMDGKPLAPAFMASMPAMAAAEMAEQPTVMVSSNDQLGDFLVGDNEMTLYIFLKDEPSKSNCYAQCAENWPPLLVDGAPVPGDGIDGSLLGTTTRNDGTTQVTYNGRPLYFWAHDAAPGDTTGQGVGGVWFVVSPAGVPVIPPSVTVQDQEVTDGTVTVAEVVAAQDGWMVIHAQKDGGIGPVIGHAPVTAGSNTDVVVEIDTTAATETLYAMLHVDEGEAGVYEFPGPDGPVVMDGKPLAPAFMASMPAMAAAEAAPTPEALPVTGADQTNRVGIVGWILGISLLSLIILAIGVKKLQAGS